MYIIYVYCIMYIIYLSISVHIYVALFNVMDMDNMSRGLCCFYCTCYLYVKIALVLLRGART